MYLQYRSSITVCLRPLRDCGDKTHRRKVYPCLCHSIDTDICEVVLHFLSTCSSNNEGTILVRRGGEDSRWGLICDDGWHARAGQVICRQLGFKRVKRVTRYNAFNTDPDCE